MPTTVRPPRRTWQALPAPGSADTPQEIPPQGWLDIAKRTRKEVEAEWQGRDFLLAGGSTSLTGGIRYAFLNARSDDDRR